MRNRVARGAELANDGCMSAASDDQPDVLTALTRKPDRQGDRALLDEILDTAQVGTLSTVIDGWPWSVPMLFARVGDDIILHGSTCAVSRISSRSARSP